MDLSEISHFSLEEIGARLQAGMSAFGVPDHVNLDQWARENFYLSAESSYVEQRWTPWPFHSAIMCCISNDDIREVDWRKSARVGYTKLLLAAMGYFSEHKRRNIGLWQPTDDDRDEFVKTELDPMLRDVPAMQRVFPAYLARHKDNTLQQKKLVGSVIHLRGGKAAKNYRRISVDFAGLDELDAFDRDVEKEGDPPTLAAKRIEGATFPKMLCGSTPKLKGFSLIDDRMAMAEGIFEYHIPCPHCGELHPLTWGSKDEPHGMKWDRETNDPDSIRHLCPHCATLISQGDYLAVYHQGIWRDQHGVTIDAQGVFRDAAGEIIRPYAHVGFDLWTAYSPNASWSGILKEFLAAYAKLQEGDDTKMKAFRNTTLGLSWEGDIDAIDPDDLKHRAEPFPLRLVPRGCLLLLCGVDTQDNRLEATVWGYGRGGQMWTIDHKVLFGNPGEDQVWDDLAEYLFETKFRHVCGTDLTIYATQIDSGGHHTHAVYEFARKHSAKRVFVTKGRSGAAAEKHIKDGAGPVDIDWRGKKRKKGVILWHVGTNLAKDLIHSRLGITQPGPGYIHFSQELPDEWFKQFTAEVRANRDTPRGTISRWVPIRKRNESLDCAVGCIWLETHLDLGRKSAKWWDALESKVQPVMIDLFDQPAPPAPKAAAPNPPAHPVATNPKEPAKPSAAPKKVRFGGSKKWCK